MTESTATTTAGPLRLPMTRGRLLAVALGGVAVVAVIGFACSLVGQLGLTWPLWGDAVWWNRVMRLAAAAIVGVGLSAAGMALQALLRNPLAEPYILGISSGAGVGVGLGRNLTVWMAGAAWLLPWLSTPLLALAGALATCLVVYGIAQRRGRLDPYILLLSGVIVNIFNGALMLVILLMSDRNRILDFVSWGMGRIPESASWTLLGVSGAAVFLGWTVLFLRGGSFNALGLGDAVATSSGVSVHRLRIETFAVVGVMTSAAVAIAGPIGFVGLIVPHVCRMASNPDHRQLVIVSGFAGAIFLMLADTICRTAGPALNIGDVPVGVLTALLGGPFFIALLRRRSGEGRR